MNADLDTVLDRVQNILEQLSDIVEAVRDENLEPTATVDLMTVGGWIKLPGRQRWRRIVGIERCITTYDCWRIDFPLYEPDGSFVHVDQHTPYPFLTAEQFDRACDRERDIA